MAKKSPDLAAGAEAVSLRRRKKIQVQPYVGGGRCVAIVVVTRSFSPAQLEHVI